MAVRDLPRKLTYEDYLLFPEDGQRHEILDGEHYVTPSPFFQHQFTAGRLHLRLGNLSKREGSTAERHAASSCELHAAQCSRSRQVSFSDWEQVLRADREPPRSASGRSGVGPWGPRHCRADYA